MYLINNKMKRFNLKQVNVYFVVGNTVGHYLRRVKEYIQRHSKNPYTKIIIIKQFDQDTDNTVY